MVTGRTRVISPWMNVNFVLRVGDGIFRGRKLETNLCAGATVARAKALFFQ